MQMPTIEAHLNVKVNSDLDCSHYYDSIKGNKLLLSQVKSVEKYRENAASTSTSNTSAAAINIEDSEDDE